MRDTSFTDVGRAHGVDVVAPKGFDHTRRVLDHWSALRRLHGGIPARAALDPRDIAPSLGHVFIAELVTPRVARMRIAGGHLHDLMGMDVRGMPLSVLLAPGARDEVMRALEHVAQGGRVQIPLAADHGLGRPAMDAILTLLPLRGTGAAIDRVLGVLDTLGPIGRAPRRFDLRRSGVTGADNAALPAPDQPLFQALRRLTDRLSAPSRPSARLPDDTSARPAEAPHRARPVLRVIDGGRRD